MTNPAANAASKMSDYNLFHVAAVLEAELMSGALATGTGTVADLGRIEIMTACTDELVKRGYGRGGRKVDGSDLPFDVAFERAYGTTVRLSTPIRCF